MDKYPKAIKYKSIYIILFAAFIILLLFILYIVPLSITHNQRPIIKQPSVAHLQNNKPALLAKYFINDSHPDYRYVTYRPWQFHRGTDVDIYPDTHTQITDAGEYVGWDMINTPHVTGSLTKPLPEWFTLRMNRPVTMAIIWRANNQVPGWLSDWHRSGTVSINGTIYPTYRKTIPSSEISLAGIENADNRRNVHNTYIVLLAEYDGKPTLPPATPKGLEMPQPNHTCPAWVHDEYKALGPDGKLYPTWHPQIDPVYWCYFNHEHGSDPSVFDKNFNIPFGYAGNAMGMHEAHAGYKVYVWDDSYGYRWLALQHQGTGTKQAACGRYHELDIAAKSKHTGEILSEQYFVGDYGISIRPMSNEPLQPSSCPKQGVIDSNNVGIRFLPVGGYGTIYGEPWTVDGHGIIGFNFADFTVDTLDPMRMCKDITCDSIIYTGDSGTNHTIDYALGFGPKAGNGHSGIYFTDPMGKKIVHPYEPGAVHQYIHPSTSISSNIPYTHSMEADCRDVRGAEELLQCGVGLRSTGSMRENSIIPPN